MRHRPDSDRSCPTPPKTAFPAALLHPADRDGLPRLSGAQPIPRAAGLGVGVRDDVPGRPLASSPSRIGPNRSALVTTLMTAVLIVAPAVLLVSVLAREVPQGIASYQQASLSAPHRIERIWQVVRSRVPMPLPEDPTALLRERRWSVGLSFPRPAAGGVARRCVGDARQPVRDAVLVVLSVTRRPYSRTSDPRSAAASGARTANA